jgi:putative PIN family toxin of toxin-antitoxin system
MRVILDTNVLLSGFAYPASPPGRIVAAWRGGAIEMALSRFILDELARTLPRLSHRTGFDKADIQDLIDALTVLADIVEPDETVRAAASAAGLRDPADVPVLAACLAAQPDYLVTGDKDLLALADRYPIVTPGRFCERHSL